MAVRTDLEPGLVALMRARRAVHPLLLDPSYWRGRLQTLSGDMLGIVWTPRPDLSGRGKETMEFRIRSHDGEQLWGLFSRPAWHSEPWRAVVRSVGPAARPTIDSKLIQDGTAEFVFQEPAGRRLADRVVDVMQICRLAMETTGIDGVEVQAPAGETHSLACNDDLLIAEQLLNHRILPPLRRPSGRFVR
ncbi:MAG: hypothetical protein VXZ39_03175 [Planctomycetota bacterium]|nr:hypothetical protein [Planctomycetota bacterium]MEC8511997.1 hypothetical protein [Planctomycetota bacterium]